MVNNRPVIYNASAGAGKTDTLAIRYIAHILQGGQGGAAWRGYRYRSTLCVTFTKKATAEMKERILRTLYHLAKGEAAGYIVEGVSAHSGLSPVEIQQRAAVALHSIVHDYSQLSVSTIDSFIQRMAASLLWELGVGGEMRISLSTQTMVDKAVKTLFAQPALEESGLVQWLSERLEERLEAGGDYQLRKMIAGYGDTLFSDAFAGRPIEERERLFSLAREQMARQMLEGFANGARSNVEAAREALIDALRQAGVGVEEFKGKGRSFMKGVLRDTEVTPWQKWEPLSKSAMKAYCSSDEWFGKGQQDQDGVVGALMPAYRRLVEVYNRAQRGMLSYRLCQPLLAKISAMSLLRKELSAEEKRCGVLLLEDLSTMLLDLGGQQEAPFIYERMGTRYDSFLIDEFQDTSRRHWKLFEGLVRNGLAEGGFSLLVGDVKQAIYRFRGGDWKLLAREIPEAFGVRPIQLEYNYRSSSNVVRFNNSFFKCLMGEALPKYCEERGKSVGLCEDNTMEPGEKERLNAKKREYLGGDGAGEEGIVQHAYEGVEQRVSLRTKEGEGYVEFRWFDAEAKAADKEPYTPEQYVVEQLEQVIDGQGMAQRDVAVLVRRNDEAARVLAAVLENNKKREGKAPIRVVTSDALSLDASPDVQMVLAVLRMAVQPEEREAAQKGNSVEWVLLSRQRMQGVEERGAWTLGLKGEAAAQERAWIGALAVRPLLDAFDAICVRYGVSLSDPYVSNLYDRMYAYQRDESVDIKGFLEWYDDLGDSERTIAIPESLDAVKLLTLHKSKGLEFRVVIMPMCGWAFRAKTPQLWGEARRKDWPESMLPFSGVKESLNSYFFEESLEEYWLEAIDSVNLLYVAFTRAKEQLYVNAPAGRNDAVWESLMMPTLTSFEKEWSSYEERGVQRIASFGERPGAARSVGTPSAVEEIEGVESRRALPRMKQTVLGGRAFEVETGRQRSRNLGESLHALFEKRPSREQFFGTVQPFVEVGVLTEARAEALWGEVDEDLQRSPLRECFDDTAVVFEERDILAGGQVIRPDRVVEFVDSRVVVIDFKFAGRDSRHEKYVVQVQGYMSALRAMGYEHVEGYLWYLDPKQRAERWAGDRVVRCE